MLLNACKNEKWAHKLTIMPTIRLLDVQESLARAITAEEEQMAVEKQTSIPTPAYPKDINFTQDRPGMHYRQYLGNRKSRNFEKAKDGKNPIRNYMRLLCRLCLSDSHLLRECPKLSPAKRVQLTKYVYAVESVASDSDECTWALDEIQDFNDAEWKGCIPIIESENEAPVNEINFTCLNEEILQPVPDKSGSTALAHLSDRSFMHSMAPSFSNAEVNDILFTKIGSDVFQGICMDNAAEKSVAGIESYKKYCVYTNTPLDLTPSIEKFS